ncbi:hypothetical protein [Pseudoduganella sp. OTU4001]|uniref:hypothetical protein n=1 Tax=Pseudoduganella sp. OTU4001 TaxID=3043854 RepID=UPI00313EA23E
MLTRTRFAALWVVVVAILVANPVDARPSGSFRGGFSSGKSTATRSIGAPRQPAFGSFGKRQAPPPTAARTPQRESAMSRDLERKAAQDQALRTYDSRRYADSAASGNRQGMSGYGATGAGAAAGATAAAGGSVSPLPPLNPVLPGGSGRSSGNGGYAQHGAPIGGATSAAAPVIVRDSNNGWLWGIGGFMLGRATDGHAAAPPAAQPLPTAQSTGAMADAAGASDIAAAAEVSAAGADATRVTPAPAQAPTADRAAKPAASEASIIAKLAVLLLIGGMVWLVWKAFRLMSGAQAVKKNANYSFERN